MNMHSCQGCNMNSIHKGEHLWIEICQAHGLAGKKRNKKKSPSEDLVLEDKEDTTKNTVPSFSSLNQETTKEGSLSDPESDDGKPAAMVPRTNKNFLP